MQHNVNLSNGNLSTLNTDTVRSVDFYREIIDLTDDNNNKTKENSDLSTTTYRKEFEHGITEFSLLKIDKNVDSKTGYYLLIGKYDGSIELFLKDHQKTIKMCTIFNHQKLITRLKFNKTSYSTDQTDIFLASGSNDTNVIIIDFQSLIQELDQKLKENECLKLFSKYKHKLIGHKERITGLSWSVNFNSNLLVSCSYDSTVQVC
jgi:WD40 repeat protein